MNAWRTSVGLALALVCSIGSFVPLLVSGQDSDPKKPPPAESTPNEAPATRAQDAQSTAGGLTRRSRAVAPGAAPIRVHVGFYVNALREVDAHAQTFADLFYWLRYRRRGVELEDPEIEELRFVNADVESMELEERKAIGEYNYVLYRVKAQFHFLADFRRYPFDIQKLPIEVQHGYLRADQLQIIGDHRSAKRSDFSAHRQGLADAVGLADMDVTDVEHGEAQRTYHSDFGDSTDPVGTTTVSVYSMVIVAAREVWPFLIKIVIPLLIIQILAYLVFFMAADRIDVAVGLTVTSLLASITFLISLADSLPDIGYLTTADRIFHLSYFLIMVAMGQMVYAYHLFVENKLEQAQRLDMVGRIVYPLVFFAGVAAICVWF